MFSFVLHCERPFVDELANKVGVKTSPCEVCRRNDVDLRARFRTQNCTSRETIEKKKQNSKPTSRTASPSLIFFTFEFSASESPTRTFAEFARLSVQSSAFNWKRPVQPRLAHSSSS